MNFSTDAASCKQPFRIRTLPDYSVCQSCLQQCLCITVLMLMIDFHLDSCTVHCDLQEQPMLLVLQSAVTTDNEEKLVL